METIPIKEIVASAGTFETTSPWVEVSQAMINQFADATHDHQFIHVDEARAKAETPYGGTIAHGFLTLSLLSKFAIDSIPKATEAIRAINYGFDKIRFLTPVRSGSRVRGNIKLAECTERKPGEFLSRYIVSVEIEGEEKPALIAEWLGMAVIDIDGDN